MTRCTMKILLIVLLAGVWSSTAAFYDFCSIKCPHEKHILCGPAKRGDACKDEKPGLSFTEQEILLKEHNLLRQQVAQGTDKNLTIPTAGDMMELSWHTELADMAQRWLDTCRKDTDPCRVSSDNSTVGQNIIQGSFAPANSYTRDEVLKMAVKGWYLGGHLVTTAVVKQFNPLDKNFQKTGLFTQLIWGKITHIGCGMTQKSDQKESSYRVICNYKPAGNFNKMSIYQAGKPCSACPVKGPCSNHYPGLCAINNKYKPPVSKGQSIGDSAAPPIGVLTHQEYDYE